MSHTTEEIAERDADYREKLRSMKTTELLRMLYDADYEPLRWQERLIDDEIDARLPPRAP